MPNPRPSTIRGVVFMVLACATGGSLNAQLTESPQTIAPGRLLFEIDGLRLAYDRDDSSGTKHTAVAVASTLLSTGISENWEVQVGAELFLRETFSFGGARDSRSG